MCSRIFKEILLKLPIVYCWGKKEASNTIKSCQKSLFEVLDFIRMVTLGHFYLYVYVNLVLSLVAACAGVKSSCTEKQVIISVTASALSQNYEIFDDTLASFLF